MLSKSKLIYQSNNLQVYKTSFNRCLINQVDLLAKNEPFVLLDSAGPLSPINQWSFLATNPQAIFSYKDGRLDGSEFRVQGSEIKQDPFLLLRKFFTDSMLLEAKGLDFSPYVGGPIGYISYDAARYIEKLPQKAVDDLNLPDFYFMIPSRVYAHNLETKELFVYQYLNRDPSASPQDDTLEGDSPYQKFEERDCPQEKPINYEVNRIPKTNMSKGQFQSAVQTIRNHIYAGDVYQVNLSQRFETKFNGSSLGLYNNLRQINPSPFSAYLKAKDFSLISSSPERLINLTNDGKAQARPIAGTRRRGANLEEDHFLSGNLLLDGKEKAEHIMLVDLERNDLGKVCDYGSVKADELMAIEKYSHVIHIVSNVSGYLHKNKDQFDLIKAMFPGGTITGCPKVRCMELVEELEPTRRGPYTGSLGYLSYNGNMDFNILIRTIVEKAGKAYIQAGAGIVADSVSEREYYETISKAQALFKSLGHSFEEKKWEAMSI